MAASFALMNPRIRLWLGAAVAAQMLASTHASGAMAAEAVTIRIDNFTFGPDLVTVAPGTAVTWINGDDIPHTVVSQTKQFRSKTLDTDDRYTFTFDAPGEYPYFCSLHPHMTGKVVVKPPAG
ncbi:cupredoxin domain-containing protein [Methylobacterium haplocladii]|uniref:Amicyanin n=1 Tax=Methylobacterium haplocladii TaxID=1176176 RepID=A0A512IRY0_9HYPH|nr:cupredoxin family copper-binding protein [Methylobacterium haplocladii]GEP00389.1 amicyanin [Methylobacterium haplocladii]GJD82590.1 Plastocyanin [Methylobacterium haplocladii]GLS58827.1 amicyanin [Methylobacterium haplocladii]